MDFNYRVIKIGRLSCQERKIVLAYWKENCEG